MRRIDKPIKTYPLSTLMKKKKVYTIHISNNNVFLLLSKRKKRTHVVAKIVPYEWDIPYVSREKMLSKFEWGKPFWMVAEHSNNTYKITRVLTEIVE